MHGVQRFKACYSADGDAAGAGTGGGAAAAGGNGGAGVGAGDAGAAGAGTGGQSGQGSPGNFREYIDEKGNFTKPDWAQGEFAPLAKKFTSLPAFQKSYLSLERQLSARNTVAVPGEQATDEERNSFYAKIGRPESADKYEFAVPDELKEMVTPELTKPFRELAFKEGLTAKQVQAITSFYYGDVAVQMKAQADSQAAAVADLKKEWGVAYDAKLEDGRRAMTVLGFGDILKDPSLSDNPAFIKLAAKLGMMLGEDKMAGARGAAAAFRDPLAEINAIKADRNHPVWNREAPGHKEAKAQWDRLHAAAFPEKK